MVDTTRAPAATPPALPAGRPIDIPTLTGLRAFAALVVVVHHLRPLTDAIAPHGAADAVRPLLDGGMLGVDVFFVLSGFVIAHSYAHRLAAPARGAVRDYLVARLARVYPLHLVTMGAWILLLVVGVVAALPFPDATEYTPLGFVGNLLMLQALPGIPAWNFPAWSISCEFAAYLVFPLVAARVLRMRWLTSLVLAGGVLCLQLYVMHALADAGDELDTQFWPRIAGEFAVGVLLWVVWRHVLRPGWWADALAVLCVLGPMWLLWTGYPWPLAIPLLALLVPAAACATGPVRALLAHPLTQWGGRISYALYLVHITILAMVLVWGVPDQAYLHRPAWIAALVLGGFLVASIAAAALLHHGVEEPARRWVRRRLAARCAPAEAVKGADSAV